MAKHLVVINQAANYLTVGLCNAFNRKFNSVTLITGSVHVQGEDLDSGVYVHYINRWHERPARKKALSYGLALVRMWWVLMTRYRRYEVLFVSVPPMGYLLNLIVPHKFSMVIWDLYPDVLKVKGMKESHLLYRVWARLNRLSFRNAHCVITISEVMAEALARYIDRDRVIVQPIWSIFNGAERVPRARNRFIEVQQLKDRFIVQYSGNIGLTHNVELLIAIAERLQHDRRILFQIIGRGPREPSIRRDVAERGLANVQMLPFQSDEMFPHSLSAADLGVVMLDERVSQGSVPSKAYNLMSFGIPSLYVAAENSQLARDAKRFGHARCFSADALMEIVDFVRAIAHDPERHAAMSRKAREAASNFGRANADRFAAAYMDELEGAA